MSKEEVVRTRCGTAAVFQNKLKKWMFHFKAANGHILNHSQAYSTKLSAEKGRLASLKIGHAYFKALEKAKAKAALKKAEKKAKDGS